MSSSCPPLSELTAVFGNLDGTTQTNKKQLCENIFDVQRSELFNVLERLRTAFWSDQALTAEKPIIVSTPTIPTPPAPSTPIASIPSSPMPSLKRLRSESAEPPSTSMNTSDESLHSKRETAKRARTEKLQQLQSKKTTTKSLWKLKVLLIRQLRGDNQKSTGLLTLLKDVEHSKTEEQRRQLGFYLLPVAKAMRREVVITILNKWCA